MKQCVVRQPGGLDKLEIVDVQPGEPGAGEVLVRWHATSLNFHDYMVANGAIPVPDGRVPMSDGAGEIVALGDGVANWQVGDKVMSTFFPLWRDGAPSLRNLMGVAGETVDGFALEQSVVGADTLTRIPAGYSFAEAATLPCAALTAWRAIVEEGNVKAGQWVLVEGTGGMSMFGLQIAKAAGARVVATTSSAEKAARLQEMGADLVVNYREDERWGKTIFGQTDGGVDIALDVGGGATIKQTTEAAAVGGHIVLIGVLGGRSGEIVFPKYFFKQLTMTGIAVGSHAMQERMVTAIETNGLKPVIDRSFALDQLAGAFEYQASGQQFGKIVAEY
ncbi:MAG: NAD(P)-dependent alcohol dehydrogenase [Pseudomonadota bacterium]